MQKQFKHYPRSNWASMTIVNDGLFSRDLAKDVFKLSYEIII
jgi:hypothetical protein